MVFGFWVCCCVWSSVFRGAPLAICRVSILSMMTWAHRPHGVRTRAKKRLCLVRVFVVSLTCGLSNLTLPPEISLLGPLACDNCKLLVFVDLSSTPITEIREYTFSRCVGSNTYGFQRLYRLSMCKPSWAAPYLKKLKPHRRFAILPTKPSFIVPG